jgi:hypothetical protein
MLVLDFVGIPEGNRTPDPRFINHEPVLNASVRRLAKPDASCGPCGEFRGVI